MDWISTSKSKILTICSYQFYTQSIATLCHILWCYLFIECLGLGLLGCAISLALTEFMGFVLLLVLMKVFSSIIIIGNKMCIKMYCFNFETISIELATVLESSHSYRLVDVAGECWFPGILIVCIFFIRKPIFCECYFVYICHSLLSICLWSLNCNDDLRGQINGK